MTEPAVERSAVPRRATRRDWIGLAVIALPCVVYAMDLTVLNLALPALSAELAPSASQLLWIVDVYGFMVAGFLITMGTLGDRIGRRRLLMVGAAAFGIASATAAFSTSAEMLIAMRALLGIAGATLAPSTLSLIRNMFHDEGQRRLAIGIWISSYSVGGAIGPLVGGALLEWFHWGSVFLVAVPAMALLLLLGPVLLPEYRDPAAGRLDLASVGLSLAAVLPVIYGIKRLAEHGLQSSATPLDVAAIGFGGLFAVLFVRRQSTLAYPLLDLKLLRVPTFAAAVTAYALSCLAMFGIYILVAQHLQAVLGLTPLQAGFAIAPWSMAFIAGSMATPWLAGRAAPAALLVGGLVVAAVGFAMLALADGTPGVGVIVASTVVMGLGMAPVFTLGNEMILAAAPPERAGAASGISETSSEFSGAMGIALFGSLGALLYRSALSDSMPAGIPSEVAASALATVGAAVAAAGELPLASGGALLDAARDAFVLGLRLAAGAAAAIHLGAAVIAMRMLRGAPLPGREPVRP